MKYALQRIGRGLRRLGAILGIAVLLPTSCVYTGSRMADPDRPLWVPIWFIGWSVIVFGGAFAFLVWDIGEHR